MSDKKISKKEFRDKVSEKIEAALGDMRGEMDSKKFLKRIRKVSNVLADDIAKAAKKIKAPETKPIGKAKKTGGINTVSKLPAKKTVNPKIKPASA